MAKGSRGGQRGTTGGASFSGLGLKIQQALQQTQAQAQAPEIDDTQVAPEFDKDYNDFIKMSEDEKVDAITTAIQGGIPNHLSNTDFQKMIYNLKFNDKPQLVDDKTLDSMNGTEMFRTVNSVYDSRNDIGYSAKEIAKQVQSGSITRTSDNGGSVFGRGIYFADDYLDSASYGRTAGDTKKTAVIRAKLNSNAKVISHNQAMTGVRNEINSGSKLGKLLNNTDYDSRPSIFATVKGYNVITSGHGYYVILNRRAVSMSKDIKAKGRSW